MKYIVSKKDLGADIREPTITLLKKYLSKNELEAFFSVLFKLGKRNTTGAKSDYSKLEKDLGGLGMFEIQERNRKKQQPYEKADRPIYRPFQYAYTSFNNAINGIDTRHFVSMSCAHIESCVKRLKSLKMNESLTSIKEPLGTHLYARWIDEALPTEFLNDLRILNNEIYREAKHYLESFDRFEYHSRKNQFFNRSEALAIFLICRKMGVNLLEAIEKLENENPEN